MRTDKISKENAERLAALCRHLPEVRDVELTSQIFGQVQLHRNNQFYDFPDEAVLPHSAQSAGFRDTWAQPLQRLHKGKVPNGGAVREIRKELLQKAHELPCPARGYSVEPFVTIPTTAFLRSGSLVCGSHFTPKQASFSPTTSTASGRRAQVRLQVRLPLRCSRSAIHNLMSAWRVTPRWPRLTVQPGHNPCREVHIHPLHLLVWAPCFRPVDLAANILSAIKFPVELTCFHSDRSPVSGPAAPR